MNEEKKDPELIFKDIDQVICHPPSAFQEPRPSTFICKLMKKEKSTDITPDKQVDVFEVADLHCDECKFHGHLIAFVLSKQDNSTMTVEVKQFRSPLSGVQLGKKVIMRIE